MRDFAETKVAIDGERIRMSTPLVKIDKETRMVHGFATLANVDKQGDIVTAEASKKAFESFRGNVREMHQPISVGRVVSFKEETFYDEKEDKFYDGIFVSAYISKGAQDTWEKVLDGTLSGFSIGGVLKETEPAFNEKLDKTVRVVKDYELYELSLVDNPANQYANIISIEKLDDGTVKFDMLVKGTIENVFWCNKDSLVRVADSEASNCPACSVKMENIGFVESNDGNKAQAVKTIFDEFRKSQDFAGSDSAEAATEVAENIAKEESIVAEETVETVEKAEDAVDQIEETVEKSEEATTPAAESGDADLAKAVDEIKSSVATAVSELTDAVKSVNESVPELTKALEALKSDLDAIKGQVDEFGKRVDAVEADTAVRKSGDLGGIAQVEEKVEKSVWGGRFLKSADLYR